MRIHASYHAALPPIGGLLLTLVAIQFVLWPNAVVGLPKFIEYYAQWHMLLEVFAIVVSTLAFGVCWSVNDRQRPGNLMLLASSCLGVALLDLLHVMSYHGMPDLVTPSGPEKAINFWLGARLLSVIGLLLFVYLPARPLRGRATRWVFLAGTLALVAAMGWMGLWHPDWAPRTFVPGEGLTPLKLRAEYLIIGLYTLVATGLYRQMSAPRPYDVVNLFAATCVLALAEVFFTFYAEVTDAFNMIGHVYKIVAYALIYRAVFNSGIKTPYQLLNRSRNALDRSNKLLHNIIETIPLRVYWKDRDLRYQGCNAAFARDMGEDGPGAVVGKCDAELRRGDWAGLTHRDDMGVMASNAPRLNLDERLDAPDNGEVWLRTSKLPIRDENDEVVGVLGVYDDITERKRIEQFQQLTASAYENSSDAIMVTDAGNRILSVNPAFTRITGFESGEVLGKSSRMLDSGLHDREFFAGMVFTLNATGCWHGEMWYRPKSGEAQAIFISVNTIRNEAGVVDRYVSAFSDITQRKKSEELIWRQANFDLLTGLPNRSMFYDRLEQEIKKSARSAAPMALMLLDLDLFKEVNDTLGHDVGDQLLKDAALRITGCVRETDTVARLGGDEFTVMLGELDDLASVDRIAEDILRRLAEPFHLGVETTYVTASIGITFFPDDATDIDGLFKNADQAMYAAKRAGRSRRSYFTNSMQESAQKRMRLANDLRHSVGDSQFRLHYQPIVDMQSGAIYKAEALLRWQHPSRGLIFPGEFIQIAEDTGMIIDIGDWVFREAVRQVAAWRKMFYADFQISVNKSPVQFRQEGGGASWAEHLRAAGIAGDSIVVEITEGLLMDASPIVTSHLLEFRDAGINVSLDDFGTGYSSLSYLKKFDIDYLKIDQSFVRNLSPESQDLVLCEAIIVMAHKLGMKVVAEGVETTTQRDLLLAMGCDYAQGYLYSRPVPPAEFEDLLQRAQAGSVRRNVLPLHGRRHP